MPNVVTSRWDLREVSLDIRAVWPPAQPALTIFYGSRRVAAGWLFWNLPLTGLVLVFPSGNLNQLIPSIPTALTFISSKISDQIVPSLLDLQLQSSLIAFNQIWPPTVDNHTIKPLFLLCWQRVLSSPTWCGRVKHWDEHKPDSTHFMDTPTWYNGFWNDTSKFRCAPWNRVYNSCRLYMYMTI